MTPTRYAFIKANRHADIVNRALEGFCELITAEQIDVFEFLASSRCRYWPAVWLPLAAMLRSPLRPLWWTAGSIATSSWRKRS